MKKLTKFDRNFAITMFGVAIIGVVIMVTGYFIK